MTLGEFIGVALVVSAPLTLAFIVSLIRGYDIDLRMTRDEKKRSRWWRRRDDEESP